VPSATLLLRNLPGYRGEAHLYRLDPPLDGHTDVVVTSTRAGRGGGPVTVVHAADGAAAWLPGSARGAYGHLEALLRAGYRQITARALAPACVVCHRVTGRLLDVGENDLQWWCDNEACLAFFWSDRDGLTGVLRKDRARRLAANLT
jgi:mono/diheme cytochrome c family protein